MRCRFGCRPRLKRERRIARNYINVRRRRQIWIACLMTCDCSLHGAAFGVARALPQSNADATGRQYAPTVRVQAEFR
jgi:hypothetical protein